ncbi:MAG: hypothetical protein OEZ22_11230 [Spirochaetia bacterium]|nr:hypothetical protein [Spirochaetia bacterium]
MLKKAIIIIFFCLLLLIGFREAGPEAILNSSIRKTDLWFHKFMLESTSKQEVKQNDWIFMRRYYYLTRFFSSIGIERCDTYYSKENCNNQEYLIYQVKEKNPLLRNLEIHINENPQVIWIFNNAPQEKENIQILSSFFEISHYYLHSCREFLPARWIFLSDNSNTSLLEDYNLSEDIQSFIGTILKMKKAVLLKKENNGWQPKEVTLGKGINLETNFEYLNSNKEKYKGYFCSI